MMDKKRTPFRDAMDTEWIPYSSREIIFDPPVPWPSEPEETLEERVARLEALLIKTREILIETRNILIKLQSTTSGRQR